MKTKSPKPLKKPGVRLGGRLPGSFDKAKQTLVLNALVARRGNVSAALKDTGVRSKTYYRWRKHDPTFAKRIKASTKKLEHFLFEAAINFGLDGDTTLLIFALKALNRARFDDGFIKQKYALDRGLAPTSEYAAPVRAILIRDKEPWKVQAIEEIVVAKEH